MTAIKKTKPVATKSSKPVAKAPVKKTSAKVVPIKTDLTPLEKARIAKAKNAAAAKKTGAKPGVKAKAGAKPVRKPIPTWKAPADFKPFFLSVLVKTEKDGLLASAIRATRYVGRYDPQAPDKKKFDLASYDQSTLQGLLSRLSMTTYATNALRRLPANTTFKILLRVNRKSKDGMLSIIFKEISVAVTSKKTGRVIAQVLDKKDPQYRIFRKSARILPAAFKNVLMPPKRVRGVKVSANDEEE